MIDGNIDATGPPFSFVFIILRVAQGLLPKGVSERTSQMQELPKRGRMLRITRAANGETVFRLSGEMDAESVAELEKLFKAETNDRRIILDLKNLTLVDREAVIFLAKCETDLQIRNCPPYIREWVKRERGGS